MEFLDYQLERIKVMKKVLPIVGSDFVLKGGTAILLYYNLSRFSEDIHLDAMTANMDISEKMERLCKEQNWSFSIKKNTPTVFRIIIDYGGKRPNGGDYPLKVEISGRNRLTIFPETYQTLDDVNVYTINTIKNQKITTMGNRSKIRDFYDVAFMLREYPEIFNYHDLTSISIVLAYNDMDTLLEQLNAEVEKYNLSSSLDTTELVISTYDKVESMLLAKRREIEGVTR